MLGVFAEFETNLRRERQLEGGSPRLKRPASIDAAQVKAMKAQGRDREGPQDRTGVGLSGVGSRLSARRHRSRLLPEVQRVAYSGAMGKTPEWPKPSFAIGDATDQALCIGLI
jgi:hypothetical protein